MAFLVSLTCVSATADEIPALPAVFAAWREQQELTSSIVITFDQSTLVGTPIHLLGDKGESLKGTTLQGSCEIRLLGIDDPMIYVDSDQPVINLQTGIPILESRQTSHVGDDGTALLTHIGATRPEGRLYHCRNSSHPLQFVSNRAIGLVFRPLVASAAGIGSTNLANPRVAILDDRTECVAYDIHSNISSTVESTVWLVPR
ncbi:MAG: hypothetical protein KDA47_24770, partial [Planctomycetales bacterium]|nr:hypothetical protein [Planctomycetales bacterium]